MLLLGWGDDFVTLMAGVIILNLLSGPPMFKTALVTVGEARNVLNLTGSSVCDEGTEYKVPGAARCMSSRKLHRPLLGDADSNY